MPIYQQLVNFNDTFNRLKEPPVIVNDLVNSSMEDKEEIENMITTRYNGDMISLLASCRCGATKGEFSLGVKCTQCGTLVQSTLEDDIQSSIWFRKPYGVDGLINPHVLIMLRNRFKKSGFNVIQWICDPNYRANVVQPPIIKKIIDSGMRRGYNFFVHNFAEIMAYLFSLKEFQLKKGQTDYLKLIIAGSVECRHHPAFQLDGTQPVTQHTYIFSDYIPLPNKSILIIERTNVGVYVDPIIVEAVDATKMIVSIDKNFYDQTIKTKESRTVKALFKLCDFYEKFFKNNLSPKQGQLRRHIYGTRTIFSVRAVVSSITDTHEYDEIHVPWGIGVTVFRPHLISKLEKLGLDRNIAIELLNRHVSKYDPTIDKLLNELIQETYDGRGPRVLLQRNPSLKPGSAQLVRITKFKTDPNDNTISLSILIVKSFNCDFDIYMSLTVVIM